MVITPNSKVKLIKNPLKLDSNNEITFTNATAQYNYFTSLPKLEFNDLTYVRKDDVLRVPTDETGVGTTYEKLLGYNFCMYQNTAFGNKWFYAFIDDIKWINPSLTEMHLKTAYFQTWQFDLVYANSFIEREHVNDDTIGKHTIPEGLETGEYIVQNFSLATDVGFNYLDTTHYVVALSDWPFGTTIPIGQTYNGVFSGFRYLVFNSDNDLRLFINDIQDESSGDPIGNIFLVPSLITELATADFEVLVEGKTWKACWLPTSATSVYMGYYLLSDKHTLDQDYNPVNNKCLCYPYRYILVNNNTGSSAEYKYEWFYNSSHFVQSGYNRCKFNVYGVISPGCSIKLFPEDYNKNQTTQNNIWMYGLDGGKLPTCSWWNDGYTNWLTQNAVNMPLTGLGNVTNTLGSLMSGNISGAASGITGIFGQVGEIYSHSLEPATGKGGVNQGDLMFSSKLAFNFYRMSIRKEYAKYIDDFFSQFGYKVNRLGTPHIHVRTYYDYCKTIDVNIEGNIPEMDLEEIRKMFNNGIRFWHDTTKYLDFSVNNAIIT